MRGKLGRESHKGCEEEDGERGRREESTARQIGEIRGEEGQRGKGQME